MIYCRNIDILQKVNISVCKKKFEETEKYFQVLEDSGMLSDFCAKNHTSQEKVDEILAFYKNAESEIEKHNDIYISEALKKEKEYLDNILKDVDPAIVLDEDQRKVILTDEDYALVIAGAGAGKTTTVTRTVTLDTTAPTIKSVKITPNPIDCGKTFVISVEVTD